MNAIRYEVSLSLDTSLDWESPNTPVAVLSLWLPEMDVCVSELAFSGGITPNSLDATSDRDYIGIVSIIMFTHLYRIHSTDKVIPEKKIVASLLTFTSVAQDGLCR